MLVAVHRPLLILLLSLLVPMTGAPTACVTTTDVTTTTTTPSWVPAELVRDPALDEAAALLCARNTDGVIDDEIRAGAHVSDGRVLGVLASSTDEAALKVSALFRDAKLSHIGIADGVGVNGNSCTAVVGSRRIISVISLPPLLSRAGQAAPSISLSVPSSRQAVLFVLGPDGFVDRFAVDSSDEKKLPVRKEGRHVVEVIVDNINAEGVPRGNPEVALLWPYVRGNLALPPSPTVLFPDAGHDDIALSHRAEALMQRLRNEQLLETLKISPVLTEVALQRARNIGGVLDHQVDGKSPRQFLDEHFAGDPRARFIRLAEVQARGSTLQDAWTALTDSPAHRYEMVSMGVTHMGVAVVRGQDALGRPTVTLVALLGRRPPIRDLVETSRKIVDDANNIRRSRGFEPLMVSDTLESAAHRLARRMMEMRKVDDTLLGGPIGEVALEADASLTKVLPLIARIDDPLLLGTFAPLLDIDTTALGVGLALQPEEGVFYVVILGGVGP